MKHFFYLHWQDASQALRKMLRQPLGSLLNLLMLAVAMSLPVSLYLTAGSVQHWVGKLTAAPQITLFMELSAEQADIAAVQSSLTSHPKVASFRFIGRDQALRDLEQRSGLSGVSQGLEGNPLPDAFVVTPKPAVTPDELDMLQKELSGLPMVEQSQFDAAWARRLHGLLDIAVKLAWFLAASFGVALVLITHNTIRMQILARQEEIEVAKLIGATDSFIRRPFLYHAFWVGALSTLCCWGLSTLFVHQAAPAINEFAGLYGENIHLAGLALPELGVLFGCSVLLCLLGARLAADHHLRKVRPH
ncbi:permease-like cell division protein FtsX [Vogesella sp. LIG4]|uniref:permease-like cell division protein FtsX n=1 Tax=Vogesella sp. LIG4 TaxID=1192162 RepID=UPI0008202180|nr:permease-like cell division protein FtsX [Vogesella sp. LIG4]SCK10393.1 cell division protein FtsX [Vogesella sp. LIG4]